MGYTPWGHEESDTTLTSLFTLSIKANSVTSVYHLLAMYIFQNKQIYINFTYNLVESQCFFPFFLHCSVCLILSFSKYHHIENLTHGKGTPKSERNAFFHWRLYYLMFSLKKKKKSSYFACISFSC